MDRTLASKIKAANSALIADGNLEAVGEFFAPDYVAHLTDQDMTGVTMRSEASSACISVPFRIARSTCRFRNGLIAEDWVITDLAERLLLARKR
jgi:hypothetical protein